MAVTGSGHDSGVVGGCDSDPKSHRRWRVGRDCGCIIDLSSGGGTILLETMQEQRPRTYTVWKRSVLDATLEGCAIHHDRGDPS